MSDLISTRDRVRVLFAALHESGCDPKAISIPRIAKPRDALAVHFPPDSLSQSPYGSPLRTCFVSVCDALNLFNPAETYAYKASESFLLALDAFRSPSRRQPRERRYECHQDCHIGGNDYRILHYRVSGGGPGRLDGRRVGQVPMREAL
jgi:hypothetical protein